MQNVQLCISIINSNKSQGGPPMQWIIIIIIIIKSERHDNIIV